MYYHLEQDSTLAITSGAITSASSNRNVCVHSDSICSASRGGPQWVWLWEKPGKSWFACYPSEVLKKLMALCSRFTCFSSYSYDSVQFLGCAITHMASSCAAHLCHEVWHLHPHLTPLPSFHIDCMYYTGITYTKVLVNMLVNTSGSRMKRFFEIKRGV